MKPLRAPDRRSPCSSRPSSSRRSSSRTTARSSSRFVGIYLIALLGLEHPHRVHRARSRSATARSWASARTRRRSSSSTTAGATSGRSRSPGSSPARSGSRSACRRRGFAGPYLALATFAIPLAFIGLAQALPALHRRRTSARTCPQLHSEFGSHTNPSVWFYVVCWAVALVMFAARVSASCAGASAASLRAVRDSEIAATANGISTARRQDARVRHLGVLLRRRRLAVRDRRSRTSTRTRSRSTSRSCCSSGSWSAARARSTGCSSARSSSSSSASLGPGAPRAGLTTSTTSNTQAPGSGSSSTASCCCSCLYVAPAGAAGRRRDRVCGDRVPQPRETALLFRP